MYESCQLEPYECCLNPTQLQSQNQGLYRIIEKGRVKKIKKIKWNNPLLGLTPPPPYEWINIKYFFLELDHFWALFEKSLFSLLKISKNLLLGQQIFTSTDAIFEHKVRNDGHIARIFSCNILNFGLVCVYVAKGGLRSPEGGTPYTWIKFQCLKVWNS